MKVPAPQGGSYCVDSTEVTNAHYAAFLAAKGGNSGGQLPECAWNSSFLPAGTWPLTGKSNHPVGRVDWCDAHAYCAWAGKHLCGKIGGGVLMYGDYADATKSEWMNACSGGGLTNYPYGNPYNGKACVGEDYDGVPGYQAGQDVPQPVASAAGCQGAFPGVFDLSGNVWEWEAACDGTTGQTDKCRRRGGAFYISSGALRCDTEVVAGYFRNFESDSIGFRCCAPSQ